MSCGTTAGSSDKPETSDVSFSVTPGRSRGHGCASQCRGGGGGGVGGGIGGGPWRCLCGRPLAAVGSPKGQRQITAVWKSVEEDNHRTGSNQLTEQEERKEGVR